MFRPNCRAIFRLIFERVERKLKMLSIYVICYYNNWLKLLRLLEGYTLYDHKTNDYIRREIRITGILDKIDEYRRN